MLDCSSSSLLTVHRLLGDGRTPKTFLSIRRDDATLRSAGGDANGRSVGGDANGGDSPRGDVSVDVEGDVDIDTLRPARCADNDMTRADRIVMTGWYRGEAAADAMVSLGVVGGSSEVGDGGMTTTVRATGD